MTRSLKIAIAGSRGIPNQYGGFEQCAQYLSTRLVNLGYDVTVYNSSEHPFKEEVHEGVSIQHIWCPESKLGAAAHFIYDWLCLRNSVKSDHDLVLELGYQSSAPAIWFYSQKGPIILTNMDGLEWARSKWSKLTSYITRFCESLAVKYSDGIVSDNVGIEEYFLEHYGKSSDMIPYGAELVDPSLCDLSHLNIKPFKYHLIIARLEPENSIEIILDGYVKSESIAPFVVVGSINHPYARFLIEKYNGSAIQFVDGIYDKTILDMLRKYALVYWHGHTVGGTNPSLLEAMAANAFIASSDNEFNNSVLGSNSIRFTDSHSVSEIISNIDMYSTDRNLFIRNNRIEIGKKYSWDIIASMYESCILRYCK